MFEIIVSNAGTVYQGLDETAALMILKVLQIESRARKIKYGKSSTLILLLRDGEIIRAYDAWRGKTTIGKEVTIS